MDVDSQAAADSRIRRRILSAENSPEKIRIAEFAVEFYRRKNTDIRIIKWNRHPNKWLAC